MEVSSAGPGPSTMATLANQHVGSKPNHQKQPARSLSVSSERSRNQHRPVSILRKPSLPSLSTAYLSANAAYQLPSSPGGHPSTPTMPPTPGSATFAFPPLPPLPPFPAGNNNRKSAPPSSGPSTYQSQSVRVRGRRSRVSFREDVDVAIEERARSRSRPRSGPPAATTNNFLAQPVPSSSRRSSADSYANLPPHPVLKRATSSNVLAARAGCDLMDAFRAQTLRYPVVSPALARLSDGCVPAPIWTPAVLSSTRKSGIFSASPTALAPSLAATTPNGGRKSRAPRSPIPSWSSAATSCPSLVSSHRASMASTLTAPSMTSLLLSPPSPNERMMPTPAFIDDGSLHYSPRAILGRDTGDEVPDFDMIVAKSRNNMNNMVEAAEVAAIAAGNSDRKRIHPKTRSRRSEPVSSSSSSDVSPLLPPPTSGRTERLLRLQSSLADLRMQREKQASSGSSGNKASSGSSNDTSSGSSHSTVSPRSRARAPSPTITDLVRKTREQEAVELDLDSEEESDLDLSLPPLNAALRSHVIPSSSRLLVKSSGNRSSSAQGKQDCLGWSGSESEEEDFSRTVARIAIRKSGTPPNRRVLKRPSLPASRVSRYSDFGMMGPPSPNPASEANALTKTSSIPTPSSRRSTASSIGSRPSGTAALISALVEQKYASTEALPRPKRFVEGWGAPEVLHDDEWPPDGDRLETLGEAW